MHPNPNPHAQSDAPSDQLQVPDPKISAFGAPNGAKYKMLSPAKLPISRSPCLTVPPGISPGALLESPVLLTNMKAEPSPTTGTFLHSFVNDSVGSNSTCSPRGTYRNSAHDNGNLTDFEFKPHIRTSSHPGFSSLGHLTAVNPTQEEREFCSQIQRQPQIQILDSSHIVQADNTTRSSRELTLSVTASDPPIETSPSEANVPGEVAPDELQQTMGSDNGMQALQCDNNGSSPSTAVEKSAEDGYNWRKYGQKHVKGSEFPRSYYKCTHPNCQMKKQLERSHDGQITEIIYRGQHDHPKPEPSRRLPVGTVHSGLGEERPHRHTLTSAEEFSNAHQMDPNGNTELSPISPSDDDPETVVGSNRNGDEVADDDDPESKRRKLDNAIFDASQFKTNREPRVVVQTISEVDILDDGYRWRKYGQKVVKGNPNPRSYYKCTNVGCSVRKHVERASHDPKAVITTYEGKHNHDVPAARNSSRDTATPMMSNGGSPLNSHMPKAMSGILRTTYDSVSTSHHYSRPEETDMISLDLGVGINANQNGCTATEKSQQTLGFGRPHSHEMQQCPSSDGYNKVVVQETPLSIFYGSSGNGLYGSRDANAEGFSFRTSPVSGNLVMGP